MAVPPHHCPFSPVPMRSFAAEILVFDGLVELVEKFKPGDILSIPVLNVKERPDDTLVRSAGVWATLAP